MPVVQAQGLNAVFECRYPGALNYNWGFNGEFPTDNSYPPNVTVIPPSSDTLAKMIIPATGLYNNTVVQCLIVVIVEGEFVSELHISENATLQVQGNHNLSLTISIINYIGVGSGVAPAPGATPCWRALFSLNC